MKGRSSLSLSRYRLGIAGTGNMAEAILKGILSSGVLNPEEITALEKNPQRAAFIENSYKIKFQQSFRDLVIHSEYILISVKPTDIGSLLEEITSPADIKNSVFISIAAGVPIIFFEKKLPGNTAVIRVMPNTPALIGKGISVISCSRHAKEADIDFVKKITGSIGQYIILDEKLQNAVTAVSGSGPAYFFLFCRFLTESAIKLGIDRENAEKLVTHTASGASELLKEYKSDSQYLIKMVASPGGTTEAALSVFESEGLGNIIEKAAGHAYNRAVQIQDSLMLREQKR